jgi:hypothetical protein
MSEVVVEQWKSDGCSRDKGEVRESEAIAYSHSVSNADARKVLWSTLWIPGALWSYPVAETTDMVGQSFDLWYCSR